MSVQGRLRQDPFGGGRVPRSSQERDPTLGARPSILHPAGDRIRIGVFANNIFKEDGVLRRAPLASFGHTCGLTLFPLGLLVCQRLTITPKRSIAEARA